MADPTVGSTNDQIGILLPSTEVVEERCTSKWPSATVAKYVDIGSVARQSQVVCPARVTRRTRSPLATAWKPRGTRRWKA